MTRRLLVNGLQRIIITNVYPEIDCGQYPIKRCVGEDVLIEADIFAEGNDKLAACVCFRHETEPDWYTIELEELDNDRWRANFSVKK